MKMEGERELFRRVLEGEPERTQLYILVSMHGKLPVHLCIAQYFLENSPNLQGCFMPSLVECGLGFFLASPIDIQILLVPASLYDHPGSPPPTLAPTASFRL